MTATATSPASIFRPFVVLAASAFAVGFVGVMALNSASLFAQMGVASPVSAGITSTAPEAVASPAASGAASEAWNFPKSI